MKNLFLIRQTFAVHFGPEDGGVRRGRDSTNDINRLIQRNLQVGGLAVRRVLGLGWHRKKRERETENSQLSDRTKIDRNNFFFGYNQL